MVGHGAMQVWDLPANRHYLLIQVDEERGRDTREHWEDLDLRQTNE